MKKDSRPVDTTSRRQFTRIMVSAAVAAPIAASMVGCGSGSNTPPAGGPSPTGPGASPTAGAATTGENPCTVNVRDGFTEISLGGLFVTDEHIPPMNFKGGSLTVDSRHKLKVDGAGTGPFTYTEDGVTDPDDQYGDIRGALVITETTANPFFKVVGYSGLLPGAQLLLWYQDISPTPQGDDDATYPPVTFADNDPDVRVIGGRGTNPFKMITKRKRLDPGKSHKASRPNRFIQTSGGPFGRHFRIGQWRLVNSSGTTLVGASGDENYIVYLRFGHFQ